MYFITADDQVIPCAFDDGNDHFIIRLDDWEENDELVALSLERGVFQRVSGFQVVYETDTKVIISVELDDEESGSEYDHECSDDSESESDEDSYSEEEQEDEFDWLPPNAYDDYA